MHPDAEGLSFGELLRHYREKSVDRKSRKHLSQGQFAAKLSQNLGLIITRNRVGNWESNKTDISIDDRKTLIAVLTVLYQYEGITTQSEAEHLLIAGGYRALNNEEAGRIAPPSRLATDKSRGLSDSTTGGQQIAPSEGTRERIHPAGFQGTMNDALPSSSGGNITLPATGLDGTSASGGTGAQVGSLANKPGEAIELYPSECGDAPINLAEQRLLVSTSFGAYFAGLLEKPNLYLDLESQIDCPAPKNQGGLRPLQRIFWLLEYAKGPRTMIVCGEGGMGKSTLSAKIIRCLHQEQAIDMILGDSAKSQHIHPLTQEVIQLPPGYYDIESFYARLCDQLGLPALPKSQAIGAIKDRLVGRKALILADNLETVKKGSEILDSLGAITSRDIRAIVTTRQSLGVGVLNSNLFVVQLRPLVDEKIAEEFLLWHIEEYRYQQPALEGLKKGLNQYVKWLVGRTGGIPLLMQLVLSDAARYSWDYLHTLPTLFGKALLDFLYEARWAELGDQNEEGQVAKQLLKWIAEEQYRRRAITSEELVDWARNNNSEPKLSAALSLLFERFLLINGDPLKGNFSIYPSLAEYVGKL
jgi:AAA domain